MFSLLPAESHTTLARLATSQHHRADGQRNARQVVNVASSAISGSSRFAVPGAFHVHADSSAGKILTKGEINPHVAPLLVIMALLYAVGVWYARTKSADDPERDMGTALVAAATGLLLWVASAEAWRFTGWWLGQGEAARSISYYPACGSSSALCSWLLAWPVT